jgi:XTP/dITP diphosphohydrolase
MGRKLLIASHNLGKVSEMTELLAELDVKVLYLKELGIFSTVDESGRTYKENAVLKARYYAEIAGMLTLADDSGLEVDALGGRPGVNTARYGGADLTPVQRYQHLLEELRFVPWEKRIARFRCVVALAEPEGLLKTAAGYCTGFISLTPSGSSGFGYDPVFFLPNLGLTMAQLEPKDKQKISHRSRAIKKILPTLYKEIEGSC